MAAVQAEPLPECRGCGEPTKRAVWVNGGHCSSCSEALRRAAAQDAGHLVPLFEGDR